MSKVLKKSDELFVLPMLEKTIDSQHHELLELIDRVREGIHAKNRPEINSVVICELLIYADKHFNYEESLLEKNNCPVIEKHKLQHKLFIEEVKRFQSGELLVDNFTSMKLILFLKEWLLNHIKVDDVEVAKYL